MTSTRDREDQPRRRQLDRLVRLDDSVTEAAEAAAQAAAHAVEATKAAEAAAAARAARKAKAAKAEARRAAEATEAAEATASPRSGGDETTSSDLGPVRVLEVALTAPDLDRIEQQAAEQDVPAEQLARSMLRDALGRSEESPDGAAGDQA